MEIVTWVLGGELEHKDSEGNRGILYPGLAQRMSAGTGIWHSEMNPSGDARRPLRADVGAARHRVASTRATSSSTSTTSSAGRSACPSPPARATTPPSRIRQRDAVLWAGRLQPGETVDVPDAPHVHLFVPVGTAELEGAGALADGRRRPPHRGRARPGSPPAPTAPRSSSGRWAEADPYVRNPAAAGWSAGAERAGEAADRHRGRTPVSRRCAAADGRLAQAPPRRPVHAYGDVGRRGAEHLLVGLVVAGKTTVAAPTSARSRPPPRPCCRAGPMPPARGGHAAPTPSPCGRAARPGAGRRPSPSTPAWPGGSGRRRRPPSARPRQPGTAAAARSASPCERPAAAGAPRPWAPRRAGPSPPARGCRSGGGRRATGTAGGGRRGPDPTPRPPGHPAAARLSQDISRAGHQARPGRRGARAATACRRRPPPRAGATAPRGRGLCRVDVEERLHPLPDRLRPPRPCPAGLVVGRSPSRREEARGPSAHVADLDRRPDGGHAGPRLLGRHLQRRHRWRRPARAEVVRVHQQGVGQLVGRAGELAQHQHTHRRRCGWRRTPWPRGSSRRRAA